MEVLKVEMGQPICKFCRRVGHVARYCNERPRQSGYTNAQHKPPIYSSYSSSNQTKSSPRPPQQSNQSSQNLNPAGPSTWGY